MSLEHPLRHEYERRCAAAGFTDREREIATLVIRGDRRQDIAEELDLSIKTLNNHLQRIFHKTRARSATELCWILLGGPIAFGHGSFESLRLTPTAMHHSAG